MEQAGRHLIDKDVHWERFHAAAGSPKDNLASGRWAGWLRAKSLLSGWRYLLGMAIVWGQIEDLFIVHHRERNPVQPTAPSQHVLPNGRIGKK